VGSMVEFGWTNPVLGDEGWNPRWPRPAARGPQARAARSAGDPVRPPERGGGIGDRITISGKNPVRKTIGAQDAALRVVHRAIPRSSPREASVILVPPKAREGNVPMGACGGGLYDSDFALDLRGTIKGGSHRST
jgi:hypothetical protein